MIVGIDKESVASKNVLAKTILLNYWYNMKYAVEKSI